MKGESAMKREEKIMNRFLFIGLVIFVGIFLTGNAFAATYDATGRWCCLDSNVWVNPGNAGCTADLSETSCIIITQTGNNFTVVDGGETFTGTVNGTTYNFSYSYVDGEGTDITISGQVTLSSCSSGSGTVTWSATNGSYYCNGGNDVTLTKVYTQGELDEVIDAATANLYNADGTRVDTGIKILYTSDELNQAVTNATASMYTQHQLNEAVFNAEAAKDQVIAYKDEIISSLSDLTGDGKLDMQDIIWGLQVLSGQR